MKMAITLFFVAVACSMATGQNWIRQDSPGTTYDLHAVCFLDTSRGWAVGQMGTVRKTTDGGVTWIGLSTGTENQEYSVCFTDTLNGWTTSVAGWIRKTTNGGTTWMLLSSGTDEWLRDIVFLNPQLGWAVGQGGTILKTINGGTNWTQQPTGVWRNINAVDFTDSLHGWAVGSGMILRTVNGGAEWTNQQNINWLAFWGVDFFDLNSGWVVGDNGQIFCTENGGDSWLPQNSGVTSDLLGVKFVDSHTGWAVGEAGRILHTTDGGATWTTQPSGVTTNLEGIAFPDPNHGWAVGASGVILHYHAEPPVTEHAPAPFHLSLPADHADLDTTSANLYWFRTTDEDEDNIPHYDVWVDTLAGMETAWLVADSIADSTFALNDLLDYHSYYWTVRATDNNTAGTWAIDTFSFHVNMVYAVDIRAEVLPENCFLSQNYPNPFNPSTRFEFGLSLAGHVQIIIYDVLGRQVHVLVNEQRTAGIHHVDWIGDNLPAGLYFAAMSAGDFQRVRKITLLK